LFQFGFKDFLSVRERISLDKESAKNEISRYKELSSFESGVLIVQFMVTFPYYPTQICKKTFLWPFCPVLHLKLSVLRS